MSFFEDFSFDDGGCLFRTEDGSTVVQAIRASRSNILVFDSSNGSFRIDSQYDDYTPTASKVVEEMRMYGIVGFLDLGFAKYIVVVTQKEQTGKIKFKSVWRVADVEIVPVYRDFMTLDEEEHERISLGAVKANFVADNLYFSMDVDLTNGPQRCFLNGRAKATSTLTDPDRYFDCLDDRFFWNRHLLSPLLGPRERNFVVPLICGHVGSTVVYMQGTRCYLSLISRVSRHHFGSRYRARGVNAAGQAAMEIETEFIVMAPRCTAAYVQVRGSTPLIWTQASLDPPLHPRIDVDQVRGDTSRLAARRHFAQLAKHYRGDVTAIDMLGRDGDEGVLSQAYADVCEELGDIGVKNIRCPLFEESGALKTLVDETHRTREKQGFFKVGITGVGLMDEAERCQAGVFRTSCLDCVDSTNLAQFHLGKAMFRSILSDLNLWTAPFPTDFDSTSLSKLGELFAANGDAISQLYLGTAAKYSHLVRGTYISRLRAPVSHMTIDLTRSYLGSFRDAGRQEELDLLLGSGMSVASREFSRTVIRRRRRVTMAEYSQQWYVSLLLLLRRFAAPQRVDTACEILAACLWLSVYMFYRRVLGVRTRILVGQEVAAEVEDGPRKGIDQACKKFAGLVRERVTEAGEERVPKALIGRKMSEG